MANTDDINIRINTAISDAGSAKSLQDLKKSMRELQGLTLQVGEGSEGFKKLNQAVADGREKIDDLNKSVGTLRGSGVERLSSSFGVLKEGIAGADMGKISIGMKGLGAAMSALPIFLIIEGLKMIWDNLDKVTGFLNGSTAALKEAQVQHDKTAGAAVTLGKALQREVDLLEAQGASEDKILAKKKAVLQ